MFVLPLMAWSGSLPGTLLLSLPCCSPPSLQSTHFPSVRSLISGLGQQTAGASMRLSFDIAGSPLKLFAFGGGSLRVFGLGEAASLASALSCFPVRDPCVLRLRGRRDVRLELLRRLLWFGRRRIGRLVHGYWRIGRGDGLGFCYLRPGCDAPRRRWRRNREGARSIMTVEALGVASVSCRLRAARAATKWIATIRSAAAPQRSAARIADSPASPGIRRWTGRAFIRGGPRRPATGALHASARHRSFQS
jgi:hypothetical protein